MSLVSKGSIMPVLRVTNACCTTSELPTAVHMGVPCILQSSQEMTGYASGIEGLLFQ